MEPGERIREVYAAEWRRLWAFATLITGDLSSGEDLSQSVFVVTHRREREDLCRIPHVLRRGPGSGWSGFASPRGSASGCVCGLDRLRLLAARVDRA